ncbi:MAG: glucose-6-phosphate isomerase [Bdellovibrionota bacterium]
MFKLSESTRNAPVITAFETHFDEVIADNPGFIRILHDAELLKSSKERAKEIKSQFDHMIVLGVGGSSLGGKAIAQAFDCKDKISFFENLDSYSFDREIKKLKDLKKIHWVAISKSGGTLETLAQLQFVHEFYQKQNLDLTKQMTVVTETGGLPSNGLYKWAVNNKIPVLQIPEDVGGRFSVLTPVGMFPAAFAGLEVDGFIDGAKEALKNKKSLVEFCSQIATSFEKKEWITILWIYSESLKTFGLWFQQLWAESLAKKKTWDGNPAPRVSTPVMMLGSNDQHSMLQQVMDGEKDKFVIFMRSDREENYGDKLGTVFFKDFKFLLNESMGKLFKAQAIGTQAALKQEGIESLTIQLTKFDEEDLGSLFFYFEMVTAMLGKYHNINAYDQPGVELSKHLTLNQLKV